MSKQLILITAPFNCGHCTKAIKELPPICEEKGWEFIEMKNEQGNTDNLPVDMYPTIMVRVNEDIKDTLNGYNQAKIINELEKY
jgi:hypothetical protein